MKRWIKRVTELNIEHFRRMLANGAGDPAVLADLLRAEEEKLAAIEAGVEDEPPANHDQATAATAANESDRG